MLSEPPSAGVRMHGTGLDLAPVVKYESTGPTETTIRVTDENNAIGDSQASVADKSDFRPDRPTGNSTAEIRGRREQPRHRWRQHCRRVGWRSWAAACLG